MTELFNAHNLNEMRVQYNTSGLPYNYDRAVPYRSNNSPMSYSNNSWKVLGGGIEASAYELSRFGSQLLNAEIVSEDTRDNRLWQRVNTSSSVGLAWFRGTSDGRRIVAHGGSWTGARSYLRIYRDDGLVIAIMSNRNDHSARDVTDLATEIASVIF